MTIFGTPLSELTLDALQEFLGAAEDEPLLWEAKGTTLQTRAVRRAACGFANGVDPGYLLLGASATEGGWALDGVEFPDEPPVWLSKVLRGGLQPVPTFDVSPLAVDDKKDVAVVRIQPVATPPCFDRGTIFERLPGETVRVKDPMRLSELYARGDVARRNASLAADEAADTLAGDRGLPGFDPGRMRFALALAATGHPPDIGSRLFSEVFERSLTNSARDWLVPPKGTPAPFTARVSHGFTQSSRYVDAVNPQSAAGEQYWHVRAIWNGVVVVHFLHEDHYLPTGRLAEGPIRDAWNAASELLDALGGYGPTHMALRLDTALPSKVSERRQVKVARGPLEDPASDELLSSVERELRRAFGDAAYEVPDDLPAQDATED